MEMIGERQLNCITDLSQDQIGKGIQGEVDVTTCNRKPANLQSTPFSDQNYLQLTGVQTDIICN